MGYPMSDDDHDRSTPTTSTDLHDLARRHLWMHFSRLGAFADARDPDHRPRARAATSGTRTASAYLDALSGPLHRAARPRPRASSPSRGAEQAETLEYFPIWSYAHPPAIELAAKLAELAPGDLNRVFFTTGGSEAVESAWKLARQYFRAIGQPAALQGDRPRRPRTTAPRSARWRSPASRRCATPFEPLTPGASHVANTNRYRHPLGKDDARVHASRRPTRSRSAILCEGPETVAAVFLEPVQNAGGCFVPPAGLLPARARDLRPLRRAARLRRGHLRVRPARHDVRLPSATTTCPT